MMPTDRLLRAAFRLKHLERAGWIRRGIPRSEAETVGSHSFGIGVLVLAFRDMGMIPEGVDFTSLLELAILHDIPESIVGDITPHDDVPTSEKVARELSAIKWIFPARKEGWRSRLLLEDYIRNQPSGNTASPVDPRQAASHGSQGTPERSDPEDPTFLFFHDLDKLDMMLTAIMYEDRHGMMLDEFYKNVDEILSFKVTRDFFSDFVASTKKKHDQGFRPTWTRE